MDNLKNKYHLKKNVQIENMIFNLHVFRFYVM